MDNERGVATLCPTAYQREKDSARISPSVLFSCFWSNKWAAKRRCHDDRWTMSYSSLFLPISFSLSLSLSLSLSFSLLLPSFHSENLSFSTPHYRLSLFLSLVRARARTCMNPFLSWNLLFALFLFLHLYLRSCSSFLVTSLCRQS